MSATRATQPCLRCGMPVSPGVCAEQPHVFHDRPEQCLADLRPAHEALRAKLARVTADLASEREAHKAELAHVAMSEREADAARIDDLETALRAAGFQPPDSRVSRSLREEEIDSYNRGYKNGQADSLDHLDVEASRWQTRIADTIRAAGLEPIDASGNESGDPLDWTNDQVWAALQALKELATDTRPRRVPKHTGDCNVWCSDKGCYESSTMMADELADHLADQEEISAARDQSAVRYRLALQSCAINETNRDTCGVCGQHFADCEADRRIVGDVGDPEEPACAGARARALLA